MTNREVHRVFISYSHDSEEHKARVRAFSDRLRDEGVDCWIDQYVPAPPEGWPAWMRIQIRDARFVLVVCTEVYQRRLDLNEQPGRGFGATWEGQLITIGTYNSQGRNSKFIPVVFTPDDMGHIPDFLEGVTRYNVGASTEYDALYARLTDQVIVPVPPLGKLRKIGERLPASAPAQPTAEPPASRVAPQPTQTPLILLQHKNVTLFVPAVRVVESDGRLELTLAPSSARESAFLAGLKEPWGRAQVAIAYGTTAYLASVDSVVKSHDASGEHWHAVLELTKTDFGASMEMATSGYSADDIAELRARRILLDEKPSAEQKRSNSNGFLEALIQGVNTGIQIERSPLPGLFKESRRTPEEFLAIARLVCILQLRFSGVVEHIVELELAYEYPALLRVQFVGLRRKVYTNQPPAEIAVVGVCNLS